MRSNTTIKLMILLTLVFTGLGFAQYKVLPMGNSITVGIGSTNPDDEQGYRDDLAGQFAQEGISYTYVGPEEDGAGHFAGYEGKTAEWLDYQTNDILNVSNPDIVLLHIGTNDMSSGRTPLATKNNISSIVDKIHNNDRNTLIFVCSLVPRKDDKETQSMVLNVEIEEMVTSKKNNYGYNIYFVDQNTAFKQQGDWQNICMSDDNYHPNDYGYSIMAREFKNAIVNALRPQPNFTLADDFNRTDLGSNWVADAPFVISNGELSNSTSVEDWSFMAVYTGPNAATPLGAAFTWGQGANSTGIDQGGLALRLDQPSPNANGYLVWRRTQNNYIGLYKIENGQPTEEIVTKVARLSYAPEAGDIFKVVMSSDGAGHHFDCYINGQFDGTVTDSQKRTGNASPRYAGVMLHGNRSNNIDNFSLAVEQGADNTQPAKIENLAASNITEQSLTLSWTATGDDGKNGTASSYDIRYATYALTESNFESGQRVYNAPTPQSPGTNQSVTIYGLEPDTDYWFAIKALDDASNASPISDPFTKRTKGRIADDFNRAGPSLGSDWNAHEAYQIINQELTNTSYENGWNHLAVYTGKTNPVQVSFKWSASSDAAGRERGGLALMLDSETTAANGYLVWKNGTMLDAWTLKDGKPHQALGQDHEGLLGAPQAGDEFLVVMSSDADGNHFDYYLNGLWDGRITDSNSTYGGVGTQYAGVMLHGARNNNIDDFSVSQDITVDAESPADIIDLAVNNIDANSIELTWTAVGDDGFDGQAERYDIRYSTLPINSEEDFKDAIQVDVSALLPAASGETEFFKVTGLLVNKLYYFAIKVYDESGRHSGLSNVISERPVPDNTGPAQITDLEVGAATATSVSLTWTAVGDDDLKGRADHYEIRYSTDMLTEGNFPSAQLIDRDIDPALSGTEETAYVSGLDPATTYYFAIKVFDENGNISPISNVVTKTTLPGQAYKDEFNRASLGNDWSAHPAYQIVNNELRNSSSQNDWNFLAVYKPVTTPSEVSFDWSTNADSAGINEGGLALMLDTNNYETANGYLVFRHTKNSLMELYTISNGQVGSKVSTADGQLAHPNPGDNFKVSMSSDESGHHFDVSINGAFDGRLSDPGKQKGNQDILYSGVMLKGNLNNNIDNFVPTIKLENASKLEILAGNGQQGAGGKLLNQDLVVRVSDRFNHFIPGIPVTFRVTQGDGLVNNDSVVVVPTDQFGQAAASFKLGIVGQVHKVQATAYDLTPVEFTFLATSGIATNFVKVAGPNSQGTVGNKLTNPCKVKVTDPSGIGMAGIDVKFVIDQGTGTLVKPSLTVENAVTNNDGEATSYLTLGSNAGLHRVLATVPVLGGSPIEFEVMAVADVAQSLVEVSGNNSVGTGGEVLGQPFVVKVTDQFGNSKNNIPVTFQVTYGGGSVSPSTLVTDSDGKASTTLTMGVEADTNIVLASSQGLVNSPIEFRAFANGGVVDRIELASGSNLSGTVGRPLAHPFQVHVIDKQRQPIEGHKVHFAIVDGQGAFNSNGDTEIDYWSNDQGIASANLILGNEQGTTKVEATASRGGIVVDGSPVTFYATAVLPKLVAVSPLSQAGTAGQLLEEPLKVKIVDDINNPIPNLTVTFHCTEGFGSFAGEPSFETQTDAAGIAQAAFILGPSEGVVNKVLVQSLFANEFSLQGSPIEFSVRATQVKSITPVSAQDQTGTLGQPLANAFQVKVLSDSNTAVTGHPVTFKMITGDGNFDGKVEKTVLSDSLGIAQAVYTLGQSSNQPNTVQVVSKRNGTDLVGSPMQFSATPSAVTQMSKSVVVSLFGTVLEPLTTPIAVRIHDEIGGFPQGYPVTFTVKAGGGSFEGDKQTMVAYSDSNGHAKATLIMGPTPGFNNNVVEASAAYEGEALENSPIEFAATATVGNPHQIAMEAGNLQVGKIRSRLTNPFIVKVTDKAGNALSNTKVTYTVTSGNGTLNDTNSSTLDVTTNTNGFAECFLKLGPTPNDTNRVEVTAKYNNQLLMGAPVLFKAVSRESDAVSMTVQSVIPNNGVAGVPLADKINVLIKDKNGKPVASHPVEFNVLQGNASFNGAGDTQVVLNSNSMGVAQTSFTPDQLAGTMNIIQIVSTNGPDTLKGAPMKYSIKSTPGPVNPYISTIFASPDTIYADNYDNTTITVTLTDSFRNAIPNKEVKLISNVEQDDIENPADLSNANGKAYGVVSSTKAGLHKITAKIDDVTLVYPTSVFFLPGQASDLMEPANSGQSQIANIGTALPEKINVKIIDQYDNGVPNFPVTFEVIQGGGRILEPQPIYSDSAGIAGATFILGPKVGSSHAAVAKTSDPSISSALFNAEAINNAAYKMSRVSGHNQSGSVGAVLPEPLVVKIVDSSNRPVWNYPVEFQVVEGNGHLYGETKRTIKTNYYGEAVAQLVLDHDPGVNRVLASAPGLQDPLADFEAYGQPGVVQRIEYVSGDEQNVPVNSSAPLPLKVKVTDFYGNGLAGQSIIFQVTEGDAIITSNQAPVSDNNGMVSVSLRMGGKSGDVQVQAKGPGSKDMINNVYTFNLTANPGAPARLTLDSGNNQKGTAGRALPFPLKVLIRDANGNPVPDVNINWDRIDGEDSFINGVITKTDKNGFAQNFWKLGSDVGVYSASCSCPSIVGAQIIFTAEAVSNQFPLFTQIDDKVIFEGETVQFSLNASDGDGNPITYGVRNLPEGASYDSTGTRQFIWQPNSKQAGEYDITFMAWDNRDGVGAEFVKITVKNDNRAPQFVSVYPLENFVNHNTIANDTTQFTVNVTDADDDELIYSWTLTTEDQSFLVSTKRQYIFNETQVLYGVHQVKVDVSDGIETVSHAWSVKTPVELNLFSGEHIGHKGVRLVWETGIQTNNMGFNLYKSEDMYGDFDKISFELIPNRDDQKYSFIDSDVENGKKYYYKLEDVDMSGNSTMHEPITVQMTLPKEFHLEQNYPNPFNPSTTILYQLPHQSDVKFQVFNVMGQVVRTLVDRQQMAGYHTLIWNGRDDIGRLVPSGVYFYRITTSDYTMYKKMLMLK